MKLLPWCRVFYKTFHLNSLDLQLIDKFIYLTKNSIAHKINYTFQQGMPPQQMRPMMGAPAASNMVPIQMAPQMMPATGAAPVTQQPQPTNTNVPLDPFGAL